MSKALSPSHVATAFSRRSMVVAVGVFVVLTYTVALGLLGARVLPSESLRKHDSTPVAVEMRLLEDEQRRIDDEVERNASEYNATLSPEHRARKQRRDLEKQCFDERDYGMVPIIREDATTFCDNATGVNPALGPLSTYKYYNSERTFLKSSLVTNLWVDLRSTEVFKPIKDISQDGHRHDPRFKTDTTQSYCVCNANQDQSVQNASRVWGFIHGNHRWGAKESWQYCQAIQDTQQVKALESGYSQQPWDKKLLKTVAGNASQLKAPHALGWPYKVHHVERNAIIIARRDDHNPFFQISVALNAWIMMKVLEWTPETTQLVYFDDGLPSITDELQRHMLAPNYPAVNGRDIMGSVIRFDKAMVAPFEFMGPLMRHLDDDEPCRQNSLIKDFRNEVMAKFGVRSTKRDPGSCTITIITRRPYQGRMVQRKWLNEDTILAKMRADYTDIYKYGSCQFQSVEFVDLSLRDQMRIVVESDVIIGMHGAGMVNLLWARPETHVAEIFPEHRKRWGYRNICYYVGCSWSEFRGGKDTGAGDNNSDKLVSYADWFGYFDPIIRSAVTALERRVSQSLER